MYYALCFFLMSQSIVFFFAKMRRDRVTLLVLYLILQFHFYLYALIYVSCIRWKKDGKKGAGCVEYQHTNVYVSRESFLLHPVYYVPDIFDVAGRGTMLSVLPS